MRAKMWRTRPGFTLIEMMVVITVSLALMTMVVPIFNLVTRTTTRIERKLAVYEAARMMLDFYENEIVNAVYDSRGNHFGLKHGEFTDTDKFTPAAGVQRYGGSQRHCGEMTYLRLPSFSADSAYGSTNLLALDNHTWYIDANMCALGHVGISSDKPADRTNFLADVSKGQTYGYLSQVHWSVTSAGHDTPAKATAPGFEWGGGGLCDDEAGHGRYISTLDVIDFEIAYWDETKQAFQPLPSLTAVYFAPPPKAVRFTITVCDSSKRETLTLSRVTHVPTGTGSGVVANTTPDPLNFDPSPYNRLKDLKKLYPWRKY